MGELSKMTQFKDKEVKFNKEQPEIYNFINIYSSLTGKSSEEIELTFEDQGFGKFKLGFAEVFAKALKPIQKKFYELAQPKNEEFINQILCNGMKKRQQLRKE